MRVVVRIWMAVRRSAKSVPTNLSGWAVVWSWSWAEANYGPREPPRGGLLSWRTTRNIDHALAFARCCRIDEHSVTSLSVHAVPRLPQEKSDIPKAAVRQTKRSSIRPGLSTQSTGSLYASPAFAATPILGGSACPLQGLGVVCIVASRQEKKIRDGFSLPSRGVVPFEFQWISRCPLPSIGRLSPFALRNSVPAWSV
jgi:hypothetical protein